MPLDRAKLIGLRAIAFDVDGVLTDGRFQWRGVDEEAKTFSFRDAMGISLMRRLGLQLALISGEVSPLIDRYAEKLQIPFVAQGDRDKASTVERFAASFSPEPAQALCHTCFFGDDVNDLAAMEICGLCACPADAAEPVLDYVAGRSGAGYVSVFDGGAGAVRSLADALLQARGLHGRYAVFSQPPKCL